MNASTQLRAALQQPGMRIAPGAYDAITARLIQQAGYPLVYMTGAGTSASLGYPDYGLITQTEMVDKAAILARSVNIPVISDADTGYGNELNVTRTVHEFESRGVAGIHIEDQVAPKRCGHLDGKEIEPLPRYLSKIRAACAARRHPDFYIIARTDSRASMGLDEAVERANAALAEGADMAFIEAPQSHEEVVSIPRRVNGPCLLNIVQGGKTPVTDLRDVQQMGYKLAILPGVLLRTAVIAFDEVLADIMQEHIVPERLNRYSPHQSFQRFGADEWDEVRARFAQHEQPAVRTA
ncbi:carboxyvinyl-carboxyphosphonate phosphorylmutase [Bordetella ansorpii]|uniref:Carboxyvinyl-carboxyphosphonate phosphorylmutase n=1 Tax=Bordetella ansorpii TaxID=288768 RepID=A0A157PMH7_9BORD|nr:isocitrate lyase/PEP mutase family protein [Bordetella ansorpii]SAI34731.1 carboxyvinyl-carboxyphosphonate phosphorylmutase [Bordetella ansorpii]